MPYSIISSSTSLFLYKQHITQTFINFDTFIPWKTSLFTQKNENSKLLQIQNTMIQQRFTPQRIACKNEDYEVLYSCGYLNVRRF